ncbi:MAG TPA: NAD(P)H-binding protein [Puia sp.]|nr:NAD(P)H-binding protein [Puia sp.]
MPTIFTTGGTGYMGKRLIGLLLERNFIVKALVRKGSEKKLPRGAEAIIGDPFAPESFVDQIPAESIFVQLLGVPHPGPKKKDLFRKIDLASVKASAIDASRANVLHFVYVSVAQTPARIMKDYQECRAAGESAIEAAGLSASFLRPWYVVGPGHYWPVFFQPIFRLLEIIPSTAAKAKALRMVYLSQMLRTLLFVIEHPVQGIRVVEIEEIRKM